MPHSEPYRQLQHSELHSHRCNTVTSIQSYSTVNCTATDATLNRIDNYSTVNCTATDATQ